MRTRSVKDNGEREYMRAYRAGLSSDMCQAARQFGEREAMAKGPTRFIAPLQWTFRRGVSRFR